MIASAAPVVDYPFSRPGKSDLVSPAGIAKPSQRKPVFVQGLGTVGVQDRTQSSAFLQCLAYAFGVIPRAITTRLPDELGFDSQRPETLFKKGNEMRGVTVLFTVGIRNIGHAPAEVFLEHFGMRDTLGNLAKNIEVVPGINKAYFDSLVA